MQNQHQTTKNLIEQYNKPNPLADYLLPFLADGFTTKILDVGSGPFSVIGLYAPNGIAIEMTHCDKQDFADFWRRHKTEPFMRPDHQNMEHLTYANDSFDLVCCINTLDHTRDIKKAIEEMIRVCKPKGYVYIDCCLDQMTTGHKHYWNAHKEGVFTNNESLLDIRYFGFKVRFIDNGGESRYNHIIATLQK